MTKLIKASVAFGIVLAGLLLIGTVNASAGGKIDVCHVPPGNPANAHTITISEEAWNEGHSPHQSHVLDYLGECRVDPTPVPPTQAPPIATPEPTSRPPEVPTATVVAPPSEPNACQVEACSLCAQLEELNATLRRIAVALEEANE